MAEMKFLFQEEEDAMDCVTRLAGPLHLVAPHHALCHEFLHNHYDPQLEERSRPHASHVKTVKMPLTPPDAPPADVCLALQISRLLDCMHPSLSAYRIDLLTRSFEEVKAVLGAGWAGPLQQAHEPWFNMDAAWVESWAKPFAPPELRLPPPNPYLPTDFTVKALTSTQEPSSHRAEGGGRGGAATSPQPKRATRNSAAGGRGATHAPDPVAAAAGGGGKAVNGVHAVGGEGARGALMASDAEEVKLRRQQVVHQVAEQLSGLAAAQGLPMVLASPPDLVLDQPGLRVWHKLDRSFLTPRASACFRLHSPGWSSSPAACALTQLALRLVEDSLNEDAYQADVAGLHYSTSPEGRAVLSVLLTADASGSRLRGVSRVPLYTLTACSPPPVPPGVELKVEGFSHRQPLLALRLVRCLTAATFPGAAWGNVHEVLCRKYRNSCMQVDKHANYQRLFALTASSWHWQEVAAALEEAREEQVAQHVQQALASCHLEVLVTGNMERGEALALAAQAQQAVGGGCSLAGAGRTATAACSCPLARA
ncbi:hypothetical protein V8C86DRAFT_3157294 [Haematococcus lacustris]